jgi:hypothetical protein
MAALYRYPPLPVVYQALVVFFRFGPCTHTGASLGPPPSTTRPCNVFPCQMYNFAIGPYSDCTIPGSCGLGEKIRVVQYVPAAHSLQCPFLVALWYFDHHQLKCNHAHVSFERRDVGAFCTCSSCSADSSALI